MGVFNAPGHFPEKMNEIFLGFCNTENSFFGKTDMEYLGLLVTQNGIRPINKKVEAIVNMPPPKPQKQVLAFIGLVNYYKDMWSQRSHLLHPLIELTSNKVKFK